MFWKFINFMNFVFYLNVCYCIFAAFRNCQKMDETYWTPFVKNFGKKRKFWNFWSKSIKKSKTQKIELFRIKKKKLIFMIFSDEHKMQKARFFIFVSNSIIIIFNDNFPMMFFRRAMLKILEKNKTAWFFPENPNNEKNH